MPEKLTLSEIAQRNTSAGQFFFSQSTMRFFGDTMAHFRAVHRDGENYVQRVKRARNAPESCAMDARLRHFDFETGRIGLPIEETENV